VAPARFDDPHRSEGDAIEYGGTAVSNPGRTLAQSVETNRVRGLSAAAEGNKLNGVLRSQKGGNISDCLQRGLLKNTRQAAARIEYHANVDWARRQGDAIDALPHTVIEELEVIYAEIENGRSTVQH
jgi:hypothetical protein